MLILASQSPRRREILHDMGYRFRVVPSGYEEDNARHVPPEALVRLQAEGKAAEVWEKTGRQEPVLGADTVVVLEGRVLGKPGSAAEAEAMLSALSGRTHQVMTGVAVVTEKGTISGVCISQVTFRPLTAEDIREYIATGEPMDKAGAYAIQGLAGQWVTCLKGSRSNVIGLPRRMTEELLRQAGVNKD